MAAIQFRDLWRTVYLRRIYRPFGSKGEGRTKSLAGALLQFLLIGWMALVGFAVCCLQAGPWFLLEQAHHPFVAKAAQILNALLSRPYVF
jgi:hypothetical protein